MRYRSPVGLTTHLVQLVWVVERLPELNGRLFHVVELVHPVHGRTNQGVAKPERSCAKLVQGSWVALRIIPFVREKKLLSSQTTMKEKEQSFHRVQS
jgi:hypothetical protein